jgi:NAD(P)-dependent dehydrogenase (short-subunit alcohol dehydrogenase family)
MLSSSAHRFSGILPDDYNFEKTNYNDIVAYGQAKTANLYMSNAIERYYGAQGIHSLAVHPGIVRTELTRHMDPSSLEASNKDPESIKVLKSVPQGAATTVLAAVSRDYEGVGGKYLENSGEYGPVKDENASFHDDGYASWAFDPALEDRLWEDSTKFVGFKDA